MTKEQLDAIRARLDAATPGNWTAKHESVTTDIGEWGLVAETLNDTDEQRAADARLIANAPTDLRALLDEVERLHSDPLPAAAWVREVERASFRRGSDAMQEDLANWADMAYAKALTSDDIRMLPHASPAPDLDPTGDRAFDALQPSFGTPVPPERRIRRQADVDAAFARGAEAMRTAAVAVASKRANLPKHSDLDSAWCCSAECILDELRHLPVPEDK
jgi:hypothetical protein